jgi:hypothetical protein
VATVEREIDRLFALSLDEFTAARNELARRLEKDGQEAEAERVKLLRKPAVSAWTINQLARREKPSVQELIDAGAAVGRAQERALRTGGAGEALREAQARQHEAVRALVRDGGRLLEDAGRSASTAVLDRIARTLAAASATKEGRDILRAGRLATDLEPAGFEALAGIAPSAAAGRPPARDDLAARRREKEQQDRRRRQRQQRVRELERRADEAEREADRAEAAAGDARRRAEQARTAADRAAGELGDG